MKEYKENNTFPELGSKNLLEGHREKKLAMRSSDAAAETAQEAFAASEAHNVKLSGVREYDGQHPPH